MAATFDSKARPGVCVIVAAFQYIDDSAPPAAMPAKDEPWPTALCSRSAKPPAKAWVPARLVRMASALPARRNALRLKQVIDVPPCRRLALRPAPAVFRCDNRA